jgi:hypothetical protein
MQGRAAVSAPLVFITVQQRADTEVRPYSRQLSPAHYTVRSLHRRDR